ncbi:MAG: IPT/TIG domain-containing protein [Deltaproteobacteria bacterium]|nr:IPT/TIG domain-containing protein [Deltaproteobacteria bacterium]
MALRSHFLHILSRPACAVVALVALLASPLAGCVDPPQDEKDTGSATDAANDVSPLFDSNGGDGGGGSDGGGGADGTAGAGVWLTFEVDDSANKTFADGDIKWTGSFSWDSKSNSITSATSWLPSEGPYPVLYDDGPLSAGGHEHEGATKGDHIFSTAVFYAADEDQIFEYGALNEFDNWMWIGPNGLLEVKKGASGTLAAKGLLLPKHGAIDIKIELDTGALDPKFAKWAIATHKFFVKGTMNLWTPVQLLDDGDKGDATANDGVLTFVQSKNLGSHDGLLNAGDEVQFIFVTTTGDVFPEDGQEYKGSTSALSAGIKAYTATGTDGAWVPADVVLRKDSKGKFENTAIIVPTGGGGGGCDPACAAGQVCDAGVCKDAAKPCEPACGEGKVCVDGSCQDKPCEPACGEGQVCEAGSCKDKVCDPACAEAQFCDKGTCKDKFCDPGCGSDQTCVVDVCVDKLKLVEVAPASGPMFGGTKLTLNGKGFAAPAKVLVGGAEATDVVVVSAQQITALTPAGKPGKVAVEVEVGGEKVQLADAFTYNNPPKPTVLLLDPAQFVVEKGQGVVGLKAIVKISGVSDASGPTEGLVVEFGYGPKGSLPNATPAKPEDAWTWSKATFQNEDALKGEETWGGDLGVLPLGEYAMGARATWLEQAVYGDTNGSEDGVSTDKLGTILVSEPDLTPKVTGLEPAFVGTKGGTITVLGKNLPVNSTVEIISSVPAPTITGTDIKEVTGKGLSVSIESGMSAPLPPRPATVKVTPPGLPAIELKDGLAVCPIDTPIIDGDIGTDWHFLSIMAQNEGSSSWSNNAVGQLWAAYDKTNLYIGVTGNVEKNNAIVVYVDVDYGAGTGTKSPIDLKDNTGALDDAIASNFVVNDTQFGADFALATLGLQSFSSGNPAESTGAGWRDLKNVNDFAWLGATVFALANKGLEAEIPLATLFPNGVPAKGTRVALFAVVTNNDGSVAPDSGVTPPQDNPATALTINKVAWFDLHPLP